MLLATQPKKANVAALKDQISQMLNMPTYVGTEALVNKPGLKYMLQVLDNESERFIPYSKVQSLELYADQNPDEVQYADEDPYDLLERM